MDLTPEQQAIIGDTSRIRVVEACPGSGKTRLFVAQFEKYLEGWTHQRSGIAAISFTNVAQQEIANRVSGRLGAPHFIGTIDSFMLHYVVRPFATLAGASPTGVRLMPSPFCEELEYPKFKYGPNAYDAVSAFCIQFSGGTEESPLLSFDATYKKETIIGPKAQLALELKRREWKRRGRISHSDSHFIAADILNGQYGDAIAKLITTRFPIILVDEVQDTGWFLGRALLKLLECASVRALIVGDSDQGIYEFGGADPNLFQKLAAMPESKLLPLTKTQRCSVQVTKVVRSLSLKNQSIEYRDDANAGKAILLVHALSEPLLSESLRNKVLQLRGNCSRAFYITRRRDTTRSLNGLLANVSFPGKSAIAKAVDRAGALMRLGDSASAVRLVSKLLGTALLGDESPTRIHIEKKGIRFSTWKQSIFAILMIGAKVIPGESWQRWLSRLKAEFINQLKLLGRANAATDYASKFPGGANTESVREFTLAPVSEKTPSGLVFQTIHQVKGAEAEFVFHFVPRPPKQTSCLSVNWWDPANPEERRIAFVGASRASQVYVLAVHKESYDRLYEKRKDFLDLFEVVHDSLG
jgi:DNA helicase-2/ATP-dependent DNA helicase PcrA